MQNNEVVQSDKFTSAPGGIVNDDSIEQHTDRGRVNMWIYLNNSFLSFVENKDSWKLLHVMARKKGDIEAIFPDAEVLSTPSGDYKYRTDISRVTVCNTISDELLNIGYTNFKNSINDLQRHDVYMRLRSHSHGLEDN
jgi:hypothetical protein